MKKQDGDVNLISAGHTLIIKALSGERLIHDAKQTFESGISNSFVEQRLNKFGVATPETHIRVDEMMGGIFRDIFSLLPGDWNQKWLSQNQIIEFCEKLPDWLGGKAHGTFFLLKRNENKLVNEKKPEDNLSVAYVFVHSNGLFINLLDLEYNYIWDYKACRRIVSPLLEIF